MSKSSIPRDPKVYVSLAALFIVLLLVIPRSGKFNFDYRKGEPWLYETLVSQYDFPILKTQEQMQAELKTAASKAMPCYAYSFDAAMGVLKTVEGMEMGNSVRSVLISSLNDIYSNGVIADSEAVQDATDDGVALVQYGRKAERVPLGNLFTVSTAKEKILSDVNAAHADSLPAISKVLSAVVPNIVFDKQMTERTHLQLIANVSPTSGYMSSGQVIIAKGEIITAEIQQVLDSYKAEYEHSIGYSGPRILLWMGNGLVALSLVLILFLSIYYTNPAIFTDFKRFIYLLVIFALTFCAAVLVEEANDRMLYLVPFSLAALYLLAFFRKRVVLPVYVISLLPLLIFAHNGVELYVMFLVSGVVTMYVFDYFNRGWLQFVTAMIAFLSLALTYLGFHFINGIPVQSDVYKLLYLFLGALLSVAGYPVIYLFERAFMLVSSSRLMELADTGNSLLVELAAKAPGTFQHSLQVMNMSDAAAKSIDANVLLVRAGALYHDVGKIMNPQCFVENQAMGANFHASLSPEESAKEIIRHVDDGIVLAERHNLPDVIKEFIVSHHGTTRTEYFYNKYVNDGGDPATEAFNYHGHRPSSKEQVIVMLCDTLEAASRTLQDNKPETFNAFVEKIVDSKIKAGQLDDADISMKELGIVKNVLKEYLRQIYHERVVYPKRKK